MKILLLTLPYEGQFLNWTTSTRIFPTHIKYVPLGILSLASNISDKHEIVILDAASDLLSIEETASKIESEKPDILGVSVVTRRIYALYELLKLINVPYVVAGGPHCTYYADHLLERGIDAVFIGNLADKEFANALEQDVLPKGIILCKTDINTIKFPDRNLIDLRKYMFHGKVLFSADNRMAMFSSIGCPNKCTFCNVQSKVARYKNSRAVVDEMEYLHSLGCGSVHILDDNFNVNKKHLLNVIDELEYRNWTTEWSGRGQVHMDLTLIPRMVATGFKRIHVGFEALDNKLLKYYNKPQTLAWVEDFCNTLTKHNIDLLGYFILGNPLEDEEYHKMLPNRIRELGIQYPFFNVLYPEPNTKYYESLLQEGYYKTDYWKEYMENPIPDFEIPYPYGETRKKEVFDYVNELIEEFK